MHTRNPYRTPPDFQALAELYPQLQPFLIYTSMGVTLDFHKEGAQRRLTEALLHRDFGLQWNIPENRICPPVSLAVDNDVKGLVFCIDLPVPCQVPNRLNYILWLQDVVEATTLALGLLKTSTVRGLDIGTGASVIYPLLGCRTSRNWNFVATDIDDLSLKCAQSNIRENGLEDRIHLSHSSPDGPIFQPLFTPGDKHSSESEFIFTMCNPPFYGSKEEVVRSAEMKEYGANSICTGSDVEMITNGGESSFVRNMMQESLQTREKCFWYTSMVGKMASLSELVAALRESGVENYAITEFVQGQTRRWAIGWSFTDIRLPDSIGRTSTTSLQNIMPPRNTLRRSLPDSIGNQDISNTLLKVLSSIEGAVVKAVDDTIRTQPESENYSLDLLVGADRNTWSRAARRKQLTAVSAPCESVSETQTPQMISRLRIPAGLEMSKMQRKDTDGKVVLFDWVRGRDRSLYESFVSHVGRKLETALKFLDDNMTI